MNISDFRRDQVQDMLSPNSNVYNQQQINNTNSNNNNNNNNNNLIPKFPNILATSVGTSVNTNNNTNNSYLANMLQQSQLPFNFNNNLQTLDNNFNYFNFQNDNNQFNKNRYLENQFPLSANGFNFDLTSSSNDTTSNITTNTTTTPITNTTTNNNTFNMINLTTQPTSSSSLSSPLPSNSNQFQNNLIEFSETPPFPFINTNENYTILNTIDNNNNNNNNNFITKKFEDNEISNDELNNNNNRNVFFPSNLRGLSINLQNDNSNIPSPPLSASNYRIIDTPDPTSLVTMNINYFPNAPPNLNLENDYINLGYYLHTPEDEDKPINSAEIKYEESLEIEEDKSSNSISKSRKSLKKRTKNQDLKKFTTTTKQKRRKNSHQLSDLINRDPAFQLILKSKETGIRSNFNCSHCNKDFEDAEEYIIHLDKFKLIRSHKCPIKGCPYSFNGLSRHAEVVRHCASQHSESFENIVKRQMMGDQDFNKNHKDSSKVMCTRDGCGKKFKRKDSLHRHLRLVHDNIKSRFNQKILLQEKLGILNK